MAAISKLVAEVDMDHSDYDRGSKHVQKEANAMKKMFGGALSVAGGVLGAQAVTGILGLGKSFIFANAQAEQYRASLETVTGSQKKANALFDDLQKFAASTPFEFPELVQASIALESFGLKTNDWIGTIGDTAAAMGKSVDQVTQAVLDAGTGSFERLKELGIQGSIEGDKAVFRYMENGKLITKEVDKNNKEMILGTVQAIWNDKYEGAMKKQSKTFLGQWSTLKDNVNQSLMAMTAGIFEWSKSGLDAANRFFARFQKKRAMGLGVFQSLMSSLHTTLNQTFGKETGTKIINTIKAIVAGIKIAAKAIKAFVSGLIVLIRYVRAVLDDGDYMNDWLTHLPKPIRGVVMAFGIMVDTIATVIRRIADLVGWLRDGRIQAALAFIRTNFANTFAAIEVVLRDIVTVVMDVVQLINSLVHGDWEQAWEDFKQLALDVAILFIDNIKTTLALLDDVFDVALNAIRDVDWGAVADFLLTQGARLIAALYNAASNYFTGTVLPWLRGLPGELRGAVPDLVGELVDKGGDLLQGLYNGITGPIWDKVKDFFGKLPGRVAGFLPDDIGERLAGAGRAILRGFRDGILAVWDSDVKTFFVAIAIKVLDAIPAVGVLLGTLANHGKALIDGVWNAIDTGWKTIKDFFSNIGTKIMDAIPDLDAEVIFGKLKTVLDEVGRWITDLGGAIAGLFGGGNKAAEDAQQAVDVGGNAHATITPTAQQVVASFDPGDSLKDIVAWVDSVTEEFERVHKRATEEMVQLRRSAEIQFGRMGRDSANKVKDMHRDISTTMTNLYTGATGISRQLSNRVVDDFVGMRNGATTLAESLRTNVGRTINSLKSDLVGDGGTVREMKRTVLNTFEGMRDDSITYAGELRFGVVSEFVNIRLGVVAAMSGVRDVTVGGIINARDAAYSASSDFYYVGQNIAVGIRNGIRDTAGIIADAAASAVKGAIDAANKEAQISSPSRRTMYTGAMIAEGLAVGINRGVPSVKSAGSRLANAAFVTPGSASGGGYAGGGGIRGGITNYGTIAIEDPDPRKIKDATRSVMVGLARS